MSENLPDSFDPQQPDLPTKAVDPDPLPDEHESQPTRHTREDPTRIEEDDR